MKVGLLRSSDISHGGESHEMSSEVAEAKQRMESARESASWATSATKLRLLERGGSDVVEADRYEVQSDVIDWVAYRAYCINQASCIPESQLVASMDAYQIMRTLGEDQDDVIFSASRGLDPIGVFGAVYGLLSPELECEMEEVERQADERLNDLASRVESSAIPEDVLNEVNLKRMLLTLIRNGEAFSVVALSYYHIVQAFAGTPGDDMFSNTAAFIEDLFKRTRDEDRVSLKRLSKAVKFADQEEKHSKEGPPLWNLIDEYIIDINCDRNEGLTPEKVSSLRKAFGRVARLSEDEKGKADKIIAELEKKYPPPKPEKKKGIVSLVKGVVVGVRDKMKKKKSVSDEPESEPEPESYSGDLVRTAVALARMRWMVMSQIGIAASPVLVGLPMAVLVLEAAAESSLIGLSRVAGMIWNGVGLPGYECFRRRKINSAADREVQELMDGAVSYSRELSSEVIVAATDLDNGWRVDGLGLVKTIHMRATPISGSLVTVDIRRDVLQHPQDVIRCNVLISIIDQSNGTTTNSRSVSLRIPTCKENGDIRAVTGHCPVLMGGRTSYAGAYRAARSGGGGEYDVGIDSMLDHVVNVRMPHREEWRIYFNEMSAMYRSGEISDSEYIAACDDYAQICREYAQEVGAVNRRLDTLLLKALGRHRGTCADAFCGSLVGVVYPAPGRLQRLDSEEDRSRWLDIVEHNQLIMIGLSFLADILDSPSSRFLAAQMNNVQVYNFLDEFSGNADVRDSIQSTLHSLNVFISSGGLENRAAFLEEVILMADVIFRAYNGKARPPSVVPRSSLPRPKDPRSKDFKFPSYCERRRSPNVNARRLAGELTNVEDAGRDLAGRVSTTSGPIPALSQILRAFRRL